MFRNPIFKKLEESNVEEPCRFESILIHDGEYVKVFSSTETHNSSRFNDSIINQQDLQYKDTRCQSTDFGDLKRLYYKKKLVNLLKKPQLKRSISNHVLQQKQQTINKILQQIACLQLQGSERRHR